MKKLLALLLTFILAITQLSLVACNDEGDVKLSLYAPDGAPALSVARLIDDKSAVSNVEVKIVLANTISTFVTGEEKKADFAILPVNAASKMLGNASSYKMLGVVTNGNLFIMGKASAENIDKTNLSTLVGKKVGVINLANVPGLTFKAILSENEIPFANLVEGGEVDANKVNLVGLTDGTAVTPSSECDYFVVPEPAATTKQTMTSGKLKICGSLQALYGEGEGYPQAVLVAKNSVIEENSSIVKALVNSFNENQEWLKSESTTPTQIVNAVKGGFLDSEMAPTFNANNLNKTVIENCAISFTKASEIKGDVLEYLQKINGVSNNAWGTPAEDFFYNVK